MSEQQETADLNARIGSALNAVHAATARGDTAAADQRWHEFISLLLHQMRGEKE